MQLAVGNHSRRSSVTEAQTSERASFVRECIRIRVRDMRIQRKFEDEIK